MEDWLALRVGGATSSPLGELYDVAGLESADGSRLRASRLRHLNGRVKKPLQGVGPTIQYAQSERDHESRLCC